MPHRITRQEFLRAAGAVAGAAASGGLLAGMAGALSARPALAASPMRVLRMTPARGRGGVCPDSPLTLTFDRPPTVGRSGLIRIVAGDGTVLDTIDLSVAPQTRSIGTSTFQFQYFPVLVTGNVATIVPHRPLPYGAVCSVLVDPGAFLDAQAMPFAGITNPVVWRFTNRPSPPAAGTTNLTVSADGTADFCTVQGAIDFVPAGNTQPVTISVRPGIYGEILYVGSGKPFITIAGQDRARCVIQYTNNNTMNGGTNRALVGVDAADFTLRNVTLHNTTREGGSQAEAFRGNNRRIVLDQVTFLSRQDTVRMQGSGLMRDCYLEGDVDFTWGNGGAFFQDCEIRSLHRTVSSHTDILAQIRNPQGVHGNVYLRCRLTGPDLTEGDSVFLARIDPNVFPFSQVVYIGCAMGPHIAPAGWQLNNATEAPTVQFWEHGSTDLSGAPLDVSGRAPFSRQLTDAEAAQWSDPAFVLGFTPPASP
jgi:pectin methylesterase-like acyl-CoA thioesterase